MQALKVFNCIDIHGTDYLIADLRYECYTSSHVFEMFLALGGVLVYAIGFPAGILFLLLKNQVRDIAAYKEMQLVFQRYA